MTSGPYGTLADVYEWTVPEAMLTPEGSVAAFAPQVEALAPGARVLDCAAGIGLFAVGLALAGFDVVASDASPEMIARAGALAAERGARLETVVRRWEELEDLDGFDAVFCAGNSLTHAGPRRERRAALARMASVLRPGGVLFLTSRNWELLRDEAPGLVLGEELLERGGRRGLLVRAWTLAGHPDDPHILDVAVGIVNAEGTVTSHGERLACWPFKHETLYEDLRAAGLTVTHSSWAEESVRYLVTAAPA